MGLRLLLAVQIAVFAAATSCIAVSKLNLNPTPVSQPADRIDCGAILGTPFHSETERQWFSTNCSAWASNTLGEVAAPNQPSAEAAPGLQGAAAPPQSLIVPTPAAAPPPGAARSNSSSPGDVAPIPETPGASAPLPIPPQAGAPVGASQETVQGCQQLRGRPYANAVDRTWFLANCLNTATAPRPDPGGPDRFNCNQIRGTDYRSALEQNWFWQNCG